MSYHQLEGCLLSLQYYGSTYEGWNNLRYGVCPFRSKETIGHWSRQCLVQSKFVFISSRTKSYRPHNILDISKKYVVWSQNNLLLFTVIKTIYQ